MCGIHCLLSFDPIFFIRFFPPSHTFFSFPSYFSYILELVVLLLLPLLCYLPTLSCVICYHLHSFIACLLWTQSFAFILAPLLHAYFELNLLLLLPFLHNLDVLQVQSFVVAPLPFHACFKLTLHTLSFANFFRYLLSTLHLYYLPTSSLVLCWYFPPPLYIGFGAQGTTYPQTLNFFTWSIAIFLFLLCTHLCARVVFMHVCLVNLNVCLYICLSLFVCYVFIIYLFLWLYFSFTFFVCNFSTNINACVQDWDIQTFNYIYTIIELHFAIAKLWKEIKWVNFFGLFLIFNSFFEIFYDFLHFDILIFWWLEKQMNLVDLIFSLLHQ